MAGRPRLPIYWDDVFFEYVAPSGAFNLPATDLLAIDESPPDRPARNQNIKRILESTLSEYISWERIDSITEGQLTSVHDGEYVHAVKAFSDDGGGRFNGAETGGDEYTWEATTKAAGASIQAAERTLDSDINEVPYALVRPSGHHAQPAQADGYCFFNNVALAAEHLRRTGQAEKVAIVDWDVHHGNGTQEIFYNQDDVLLISLHNDHGSWHPETHPQTGRPSEKGTGKGTGYNVNVPLPFGTGDQGYEYVFQYIVEPIVSEFNPDALLVSAGQDPGALDPLGRNLVSKSGFEAMGRRVRRLAADHTDGSLAIVQEGGYQVSHLAFATLGVLEGVLDVTAQFDAEEPVDWDADPFNFYNTENLDQAIEVVHEVGKEYASYWPLPYG